MAVLLLSYYSNIYQEGAKKTRFLVYMLLSIVMSVVNIISTITISYPNNIPVAVNYMINDIYYISVVLVVISFYQAVVTLNGRRNRLIINMLTWINIAYVTAVLTTSHAKLIYYFDDSYTFTKGPLYVLTTVIPIFCSIMGIAAFLMEDSNKNSKHRMVGGMASLLTVFYFLMMLSEENTLFGGFIAMAGAFVLIFCFDSPDYIELMDSIKQLDVSKEEETQARDAAERANLDKSIFLSNMSHEIRTPLNYVMGLNEIILREGTEDNIREYALNIKAASQTLLDTVSDIVDFSKIESGTISLNPREYNLSDMISLLVNLELQRVAKKGLEFIVDVDETLPGVLYGDDARIRQIATNLLTNAVKYTNEGHIRMQVGGRRIGESLALKISVSDTGVGIKEEDMGKLFARFERIDSGASTRTEGTGIGMDITQSLLGLMKSRLDVESKYGEGSTFSFVVVQKIVDETPVGEKYKHDREKALQYSYSASIVAPWASVLVVDDKEMNLFVFEQLLKNTQIRVVKATSGEQAIALCRNEVFDIIFMDHMMPDMDGIEALHILRGEGICPHTPIVALTANAMEGVDEMYLKEGFSEYISKPVVQSELEECLCRYIDPEGRSVR